MAINSVSGVTPTPQVNAQQVNARRDKDGDNDGSKPGETEKAEANQPKISSSSTVGTKINTSA